MHLNDRFETLYDHLSRSWEAHQTLRHSEAEVPVLAESSRRLEQARLAMWEWRNSHRLETG